MRAAAVTFIVIAGTALILWVLTGFKISHVAEVLPLVGGHELGLYDVAGIIMGLIVIAGVIRLVRGGQDDDE